MCDHMHDKCTIVECRSSGEEKQTLLKGIFSFQQSSLQLSSTVYMSHNANYKIIICDTQNIDIEIFVI